METKEITKPRLYNSKYDSYAEWNGSAWEDKNVKGAYFYSIEKANNNGWHEEQPFNYESASAYVDKFTKKDQMKFFKMMLLKMQDNVVGYIKMGSEWLPAIDSTTAIHVGTSLGFSTHYLNDSFIFRKFPSNYSLSDMISKPLEFAEWTKNNLL